MGPSRIHHWGLGNSRGPAGSHAVLVEALGTLESTPLGMACTALAENRIQWYPKILATVLDL